MDKPELSVSRLLDCGFSEYDCWGLGDQRINPPQNLPNERGVYAFALEDRVVYVGLASRSLRQRLHFYARPGASQRTNVRLNGIISELIRQGQSVRVLIAHPRDGEWNGLRTSGSEGLEAALIEDFDLPWNVRGSTKAAPPPQVSQSSVGVRRLHGSTPSAILAFVSKNPKCTELEIAKGVFGPSAVQPRANPYCRKLVEEGKLTRLDTRPARYIVV